MPEYPTLRLKAEREEPLVNRHHAIFRTAFESLDVPNGSIAKVESSEGQFLCYATINTRSAIAGRAISFEQGDPMTALRRTIKRAVDLRAQFFSSADTTAYRLVNAEGDAVPGLIVDRYGDVLVVQLTTLGMDTLRTWVAQLLRELCKPTGIYEKSIGPGREKEGLAGREGWLLGRGEDIVTVQERGLKFQVSLSGSQKTGLFLDQREMRSLVREHAAGRTVLDCCSYVGGFSMAALSGGATHADAVDYDPEAATRSRACATLNGFEASQFEVYTEDVFDFLRRSPLPHAYDFIVLDPPAFAKGNDLDKAKHAYTDLNRLAMEALPSGSLLLTCSCSYQIDTDLFQTVVFHAAKHAGRSAKIIHRHRQAFDHPVNVFHPEGDYLKSLLLWIE
jgi:23S rRNA (cytosine1962-C5)-methyltransferase